MKLCLIYFFLLYQLSCVYFEKSASDSTNWSLEFKQEQLLDENFEWEGFPVGGLSGLAYDENTGYFYALSDSKKDNRLYRLSLKTKPNYRFEIVDHIFLKSPGQNRLKRNMDPEDLVFYDKDTVFITSEGQTVYKEHESTQIFSFSLNDFVLKAVWPVAPMFWPSGQKKQNGKLGHQSNKGFESLTLDKASNSLWTSTEKPLFQDLKSHKQAVVRLSEFDIATQKLISQYLYPLKDENSGLTAMYFLGGKSFLNLERSFKKTFFSAELFLTDCSSSNNIKDQIILKGRNELCSKKRLWSSSKQRIRVDNLEGMSLVPIEDSNKKLLILVSDNNFNMIQKSQFLFFEVFEK